MTQDFKEDLAFDHRKAIEARDSTGAKEILGMIDKADVPVESRMRRTLRLEFPRLGAPLAGTMAVGGGAATGTAGDENTLIWSKAQLYYHILGTQTITQPAMSTTGLNIGMDQTANDGVELRLAPPGASSDHDAVFTCGTDNAFYFEVKLNVADASGTDDLAIGFVKHEAYQAAVDNYDELASLAVDNTSANIVCQTILNGAATSSTDTTANLSDATDITIRVKVSDDRKVTYEIDGSEPATVAAFTFDSGEVVTPIIYFLHATDVAGAVNLIHLECGMLDR